MDWEWKDYNAMTENHAATKTYRDGVWEVRYNSVIDHYADKIVGKTLYLSVDVHQDMTEEDSHYIGERESDFTCYAVFYWRNGRRDTQDKIFQ